MEERNYTSLADKIWSDLIPSARVFLTSVTLFLLLALLIMLVILLIIKILNSLWPQSSLINFRPSRVEKRETDGHKKSYNGSNRDQAESKVRFRGSDDQDKITPQTSSQTPHSVSFGFRKARNPETYSGKTDLEDWIRHFEIISRWNGWSEEEMGSNMASSLKGKAQQVLRDLPIKEMEDYQSILRALKRRFDPEEREGFHKDHFKTRYKKEEESSSEYGFTLSRIAASAYPRMAPKDREEIVIDQFINGLPTREIQKHVKFGNPQTLDKAIALATEYEGFEGSQSGRLVGRVATGPGRLATD